MTGIKIEDIGIVVMGIGFAAFISCVYFGFKSRWKTSLFAESLGLCAILTISGCLIAFPYPPEMVLLGFIGTVSVIILSIILVIVNKNKNKENVQESEEQKKEKIQRKMANPVYAVSHQIYSLATSKNDYIGGLYNKSASAALLNKGNVYEASAILDECLRRKDEDISDYFVDLKTNAELKRYIDNAQKNSLRPEIITKVLTDNLAANFPEQGAVVSQRVKKYEDDFDRSYKEIIERLRQSQSFSVSYLEERYDNSEGPNGLGFGVITNSVSQALLYDAMDAHEREKQAKRKRARYQADITGSTGRDVESKQNEILDIYAKYIENVRDTITNRVV